ncbi:MAG TPA: M56 family metallopeptidase [Terracidiphilus sp.]|jgi:TonB family protein|nr:M56 family metallopeptidase [Terracidiphilus sp.]
MTTLESILLSYLVNSLWQIPLLFASGWLAARAVRALGPSAEHRVWVSALLLQVLLPAASTIPWENLRTFLNFSGGQLNNGQPHVSVVMGPGAAFGNPHLPAWLLAALAIAYIAMTAWFAARFVWRLRTIRLLSNSVAAVTLFDDAADHWAQCAGTFGVEEASLGTSPRIYGPITIGIKRKLVLLPTDMLATVSDTELRTAIAHEFAHMRRHDFLKNLVYELLSLPVRFHPVLSLTRNRLTETREMVCDQLAAGLADQHQYARSLLRLASLLVDGMPARTPHAIGIFDATSFERRIMRLTEKPVQSSILRRITAVAACALLGAGISAITLALSVHVDALAAADQQHPARTPGVIAVRPDIMQNQIVHKVIPVYPEDAKKARIQGKVQLDAIIGKTGEVEQLRVVSGPKELQKSAIDAVRQWTYKPFLLNGEPVGVKTTIHVTYSLKD